MTQPRSADSHYVSLIIPLIHLSAPSHRPLSPFRSIRAAPIPTPRVGLKITNVGRLGAAITTGHSFRASDQSTGSRKLRTGLSKAYPLRTIPPPPHRVPFPHLGVVNYVVRSTCHITTAKRQPDPWICSGFARCYDRKLAVFSCAPPVPFD